MMRKNKEDMSSCDCDAESEDVKKRYRRTYATVLKSQMRGWKPSPYVSTRRAGDRRALPVSFNPMDQWGWLMTSVRTQGKCGACWAMATSKALSDRYSLLSLGHVRHDFSPYAMVACEGTIFPRNDQLTQEEVLRINLDAHTAGACNGNSLFHAMDYLFAIGGVTRACINQVRFTEFGIPDITKITDSSRVPVCTQLLGDKYQTCLDRDVAARYYRTIAGYEVSADVKAIQEEIYKWGPVVSGMRLYPDFVDQYDGKSIYMGPPPNAQPLGGHAVEIVGWGRENDIDFWWVCNSWGPEWGRSGYFQMKMNLVECELEQNVVAFIPDFPGFSADMLHYTIQDRPEMQELRTWIGIDPLNGYQNVTQPLIRDGTLLGDLRPIFHRGVPDMYVTWLGDMEATRLVQMPDTTMVVRHKRYKTSWWLVLLLVIACIGMYMMGREASRRRIFSSFGQKK